MKKFETLAATAAPLFLPNVDTDVIMPKQFLKRIDREGLAEGVFHDVRRTDDGMLREDFPLNQARYQEAKILVAGRNFGCGSSREHAVWGLLQAGIDVVIAPSFAGIFFGNCEKNGLLAITLPEEQVSRIVDLVEGSERPELKVDLENCQITLPNDDVIDFEIQEARRRNLLEGRDHVETTLAKADAIRAFEATRQDPRNW
ncbi:3-isopropylmalate dehydratase small subunit [Roseovarius sp. MMSF_3281]|uniref:3-isopropylmalate dehydratase small subunit n=1 Tax=Roseovarius sp. MMSF_3281 TaxID=3046694 RepID=UPI00273D1B16|nr:3-isopropylmalate dehydratase small subunit [Roseovarius sp. MMSF_3281]